MTKKYVPNFRQFKSCVYSELYAMCVFVLNDLLDGDLPHRKDGAITQQQEKTLARETKILTGGSNLRQNILVVQSKKVNAVWKLCWTSW